MSFNVDWNKFGVEMLPMKWRDMNTIEFVKVILGPISNLHYRWSVWRSQNLYKIAHTGQVCYLRKSLNDSFDASLRRIYIGNGNQFARPYIYTRAEQQPRFLGTMYLRLRSDYADTGVDFIVYVPADIVETKVYELAAHIEFYREGVKRYKIVNI